MTVYGFKEQKEKGEAAEKIIDDYLTDVLGMLVEPVPMDFQRKGIDRFVVTPDGIVYSAEIKTDFKAQTTGNAFLETVSVEKNGITEKLGWLYTSIAQRLIYFVPGLNEILFINMAALKQQTTRFRETYKELNCKNKGYNSRGIIVPLQDLRDYAQAIRRIEN